MPKRRSDELAAVDEVQPLVDQWNQLTLSQRAILLDIIDPLPEEVEPVKTRKSKKAGKKAASKSPRGQSLAGAIQRTPKSAVVTAEARCVYRYPQDSPINPGSLCNMDESYAVHDFSMGYAGYHEFDAGKSTAPPATLRSSTNGGERDARLSEPDPEPEQEKAISA